MERWIKKVKLAKGKVEILVLSGDPQDPDELMLKSADAPHPDLPRALQALEPHVADLCELRGPLAVRGASFSWSEAGGETVMGASVTALRDLRRSRSPMVVNSPHQPETDYGGNEENEAVMTFEFAEALRALLAEAMAYVDGKRAQGSLFEKPAAEPAMAGR